MTILFVCCGNICRSPMAEAICRYRLAGHEALRDVEAASAGTAGLEGDGAADHAQRAVRDLFGLDLSSHVARCTTPSTEADLILAMDRSTMKALKRNGVRGRVELLGDYAGTGEEVADPYGGDYEEYLDSAQAIDRLVRAVVERLAKERR